MPGTSTPLTAEQMTAALDLWGIRWKPYRPDWATHNRNSAGASGPKNGVLCHNFGSEGRDVDQLAYLWDGDLARGMPGPLCQWAIDDAGVVWLIGWGRALHGGQGDPTSYGLMLNDLLPLDRDVVPATFGSVDMNTHAYGYEALYGVKPTQAQYDTMVRLPAAICHAHGWTARSVMGHRESTNVRSDPVGVPMWRLRRDVAAALAAGPTPATPSPPPAPAPKPVTPEEETMRLITAPGRPWAILSASGTMTIVPPGTPAATYTALGLPTTPGQVTVAVYDALRASSEAQKADAAGVKAAIDRLGTQVGQLATALDKPRAV
ncbi:MAG TPA: N-acetylmuramoyl-L-alanine amidase [Intrasporangium sp.]|uniref:peptidoglycan recognition protein family protein n=1 Tax=Intrasporangium sp. TaxID=1925024 RepID=UPI002D77578D|nr:N-acetylmuramoyl-L-alanine amidase [Intrasporangium sp.]HET7399728.1 N-acetylmuramoyl-L-alanine amidase [Intrasporangium sp.]